MSKFENIIRLIMDLLENAAGLVFPLIGPLAIIVFAVWLTKKIFD